MRFPCRRRRDFLYSLRALRLLRRNIRLDFFHANRNSFARAFDRAVAILLIRLTEHCTRSAELIITRDQFTDRRTRSAKLRIARDQPS
jgi:hypothetical protein